MSDSWDTWDTRMYKICRVPISPNGVARDIRQAILFGSIDIPGISASIDFGI